MKKIIAIGLASLLAVSILAGCQDKDNASQPSYPSGTNTTRAEQLNPPWIATKNTTRINTSDPVQAAVLASRTLWTSTNDSNTAGIVVLVDSDNWQVAAASADLIHHPSNGPILYVTKDGIPESTWNELKRLKPKGSKSNHGVQVIIVGKVAAKVEEQLKDLDYKIDKVEGDNPAAAAQAIDAYYAKVAGDVPKSVIVGSMDQPEYTLPAVNWIAHMPEPLLYVREKEIPQETIDALKKREGAANIYVIGPESAVSGKVLDALSAYGKATRISGPDPFENAIQFAKFKDHKTGFGWGIDKPGHNFSFVPADAEMLSIAVAPFSHLGKHAPMLFTDKDGMPDSVMSYVMSLQPKFEVTPTEGPYNHAWITGDENTITQKGQSEIDDMLEIVPASGGDAHSGH
ncbi:cell wall-binding repeat-containing protein [Paenibacillus dakarensis]|uniref:cell wall-binding repeat-containing protein n=1 Tax=Paenibacillus dakarensis TaxID=1527293 RepID=UPI0006D5587B|nr:ArsR family transcriptional regulator [Paenibacillus dakarensis]